MRTFLKFLSGAEETTIFGKNLMICNFLGIKKVETFGVFNRYHQ